jgi:hypothetical protein
MIHFTLTSPQEHCRDFGIHMQALYFWKRKQRGLEVAISIWSLLAVVNFLIVK